MAFDRGGVVVDEGDGPLFAGLIVGDGAVAFGGAVGLSLLPDGHTGLQFAHAGKHLMRVDSGPHILGPVVINGVGIVVEEENVAEVLFLAAVNGADGGGVEACAAGQQEDSKDLARPVRDSVVDPGRRVARPGLARCPRRAATT